MSRHAAYDGLHLAPPDTPDHAETGTAPHRSDAANAPLSAGGMLPVPDGAATTRGGFRQRAWFRPCTATWRCLCGSVLAHGLTAVLLLGLSLGAGSGGGDGRAAYLEVSLAGLGGGVTGGGSTEGRTENHEGTGGTADAPGARTRATPTAEPDGPGDTTAPTAPLPPIPAARNTAPQVTTATDPAVPTANPSRQPRKPQETPRMQGDASTSPTPPPTPLRTRDASAGTATVWPNATPNATSSGRSHVGPNVPSVTHAATEPRQGQHPADSTARTIGETDPTSAISATSVMAGSSAIAERAGTAGARSASDTSTGTGSKADGQAGTAGPHGVSPHGTGAPGGAGPFGYAVHDVDVRPAVRSRVPPEYPDQARRTGTQGRVVLRLLVDENGHARHVSVLEATPEGIFDQCALDAVTGWSFTPGRRDGKAVPTWVHLPLRFDLAHR